MTHAEQFARDQRGRWRRGSSGNPVGRPRGSKNRHPRRRAELERASEWTTFDWQVFYRRTFHSAVGGPAEKHGASYAECIAVWILLNPPPQRAGLCAHCSKVFSVPLSTISGAPIRIDGAWVHWSCLPWFAHGRWHAARTALQRLGITEQAF
jgi:hypothetical protein